MTYRSTAPARAWHGGVWQWWGGAERGARGEVSSVGSRPWWSVSAAGRRGARWSEELRIKGRRSVAESSRGGWGRGRLRSRRWTSAPVPADGAEVGAGRGGSGGGEEAAAPAAGMRRQSTRGRSTGSSGGEESEALAAAVHAGRISSEDAAAQRQNIRGGGGASEEEEKRSLRVWSDVFAGGGGGAKYSAWRGWMDRAVAKSSTQIDGRDRFEASSMMNEMAVTEGEQQITRNVVRKKWSPPGLVSLSSILMETQKTGGWGFILRNSEGQGLLAGAGRLAFVHDADSAEARACQAALLAASVQGITEVGIETDSLILVSALKS
uniref:RNase H type-1 domain-containing protein n=1 Tax=Oryza rufipogon TaxID=4529 RepID=A0A0E0Q656_ORYRU